MIPLPRREKIFPAFFFSEGSCRLKLIWASLPFRGLERASQAFPNGGFFRVIKREGPLGQESPAQIPDPSIFCACRLEKEQSADFFLQISVRRLLSVNSFPESGFVSRGATAFDIFRRGVSPVEAETGERRVSGRRIEPSPVFLIAD